MKKLYPDVISISTPKSLLHVAKELLKTDQQIEDRDDIKIYEGTLIIKE